MATLARLARRRHGGTANPAPPDRCGRRVGLDGPTGQRAVSGGSADAGAAVEGKPGRGADRSRGRLPRCLRGQRPDRTASRRDPGQNPGQADPPTPLRPCRSGPPARRRAGRGRLRRPTEGHSRGQSRQRRTRRPGGCSRTGHRRPRPGHASRCGRRAARRLAGNQEQPARRPGTAPGADRVDPDGRQPGHLARRQSATAIPWPPTTPRTTCGSTRSHPAGWSRSSRQARRRGCRGRAGKPGSVPTDERWRSWMRRRPGIRSCFWMLTP